MTTVTPPPAPSLARTGPLRAIGRGALAIGTFIRRRPLRATAYALLTLVLTGGVAAGAMYGYFRYHLNAASTALARGHNAEAARHLQSCRWVRPDHPEVKLMVARVARRGGYWDEAERLLDEYWLDRGDDEALVLERLLLRASRGELESAGAPLRARVAAGSPDAALAREALIAGLVYRFRWAEAAQSIDQWLAVEPDNTTALVLRGKFEVQRLRLDDSLASFRRVVELDPDHDEARLRVATTLVERFYGAEALEHLTHLRRRLPGNPDVDYLWAVALGLQGRTAEARAALDELLRAHPTHAGALGEQGRYAAMDYDYEAAVDWLGRSVRADLGNLAVRHQYVQALARAGRAADAAREEAALKELRADLDSMNQLISGPLQTNPHDPDVHHRVALIALKAGQPTEALRWLQGALQVQPNHLPTHQTLAAYHQAAGNPVLATRHRALAKKLSASSGS